MSEVRHLNTVPQFDPSWISTALSILALIGTAGTWLYQWKKDRKATTFRQASAVTAWISGYSGEQDAPNVTVRNDSGAPIYEAVLTVVGMYGAGPTGNGEEQEGNYSRRSLYAIVPPGTSLASIDLLGIGGMHVICSLEIGFVDAEGRSWIRRGNGKLEQIKRRPFEFYRIPLPGGVRYTTFTPDAS